MKFAQSLVVVLILTFCLFSTAYIQAQTRRSTATSKPVTNQTATTEDGRKVILKSNGTWQYETQDVSVTDTQDKTPQQGHPNGILSFDTGLVFKSGDVKPMARTAFYLLDDSLENIMKTAGVTNGVDPQMFSGSSLIGTLSLSYYGRDLEKYRVVYDKTMEAIKPHIISTVTTDFSGKGQFEAVPAGSYYLYGIGQLFKEVALWNLQVDLKAGQNSVTLDQNNMAQ